MRKARARYHNVNLSRLLSWQGRNVFCPAFKRIAHLGGIPSAVTPQFHDGCDRQLSHNHKSRVPSLDSFY
jgi:hypothetical protein